MGPTIVVGIDGSLASQNALIWASRMAAAVGAHIKPVMAWEFPVAPLTALSLLRPIAAQGELEDEAQAEFESILESSRELIDADAKIADGLVVRGAAAEVLCEQAADADLLVIGSRGLGGFKGLVLGSVGAHCANAAPCAVGMVPPDWDPERYEGGEVLVGVDGSANSTAAVAWADQWVDPTKVIHLINMWSYPVGYGDAGMAIDPSIFEDAADQVLVDAADHITRHEVKTSCEQGDARFSLSRLAATKDMLILGTRGRGGVSLILLGSVASSVVHHLSVPTVLVPTAD